MRLLLVDDEPQQRHSISLGLRRRGYQITEAGSTQDAKIRLAGDDTGIDLVLTDYLMPTGTGLDLLKHIRQNHAALSVIIMTAFGDKPLLIEALRYGCNSFIEKPFSIDALIREIKRVEANGMLSNNSHTIVHLLPRIAHQINNPLAVINASIELATLDLSNPKHLRSCLDGIAESTERIVAINRKLIQLGRNTHKKRASVNLKQVLEHCIDEFANLIQLKSIRVVAYLNEADHVLTGNRFDLTQMFNNLLLNSIEATENQPQKTILLNATNSPDHSEITIAIKDSGIGIDPEHLPRIFSTDFTGKPHGNGLGLAVAQGVANAHQGRIEVTSTPEKGATFKVTLPV